MRPHLERDNKSLNQGVAQNALRHCIRAVRDLSTDGRSDFIYRYCGRERNLGRKEQDARDAFQRIMALVLD